ncbi:MAG: mono/diheme cytochrome c family protein [Pirellulaceae bacterium]|jgi:mono/diheme cytochrome c family protein
MFLRHRHFIAFACWVVLNSNLFAADAISDRYPVALEQTDDIVLVANGRTGSVSVLDKRSWAVTGERRIGERIVDLVRVGNEFVAVDQNRNELISLRIGKRIEVVNRISVATSPVDIVFLADRQLLSVTSLWARQLTILSRAGEGGQFEVRKVIDLPFAPLRQCAVPDRRHLIVADAFGGNLAVVDLETVTVRAIRTLQAHNIRGLAVSHDRKELLVAHQLMNEYVPTERARVFWGTVMSNIFRAVPFRSLTSFGKDPDGQSGVTSDDGIFRDGIHHWSLIPLGTSGDASGDPGQVSISTDGQCAVTLSGVDEVAVRSGPLSPFTRLHVQRRPTAVVIDSRRDVAIVANTLSSSLTIVDLKTKETTATISLGNKAESSAESRGESLFHDARLSLDGWFSCQSCHTEGHSNGLLNDNFGDDNSGAPKRVLTLLGASKTAPWSWNGSQLDLHEQIAKSVEKTMRGEIDKMPIKKHSADIAAYLQTLAPPPALDVARGRVDSRKVARGKKVFEANSCNKCHQLPTYTSTKTYDVGLKDENGVRKFNPPSLISVSQRSSYFHDGRAKSLRAVFTEHGHLKGRNLTPQQQDDLLSFLGQL